MTVRPAVVLLSGGLDSTTTLAIVRDRGFRPYALTFCYGQRHSLEVDLAKRIAERWGVARHAVVDINLRQFGGSALLGDFDVPKSDSIDEIGYDIPITYVPARNTIFLSLALGFAEVIEAYDIFLGVNALDYSGYPDCRPEYIAAFQEMANLATKAGVEGRTITIHAPLVNMTKSQIIEQGLSLGVDYSMTTSCYDSATDGKACGRCDACLLRQNGFAENGIVDPIPYVTRNP